MPTPSPDPNILVWFGGRYTRLGDATVNILTHALHYGTGVFEGIRAYWNDEQGELYLNRAEEHYQRWLGNCGLLGIKVSATPEELCEITAELARRNQFKTNLYIRPFAYKASARIGVHCDDNDDWFIAAIPYGQYITGSNQGLKVAVTTWRRVDDLSIPSRGKISGAYANSALAGNEARANGHDEAIFLNQDGHVAEGSACNLFMLRKGKLVTPAVTDNILEGITRDSVMELARRELGLEVVERSIDRSELYLADEIFFCGTGLEIAPVTHVDHRPVRTGAPGEITGKVRRLYADAVSGRLSQYRHWLRPCHAGAAREVARV